MAVPRIATLHDVADRRLRLRAWCYCCGKHVHFDGRHVLAYFLWRNWPLDLETARRAFRCGTCLLGGHVLLVPASPLPVKPRTWEQEVVAFFHTSRRISKGRSITSDTVALEVDGALRAAAAGGRREVRRPAPLKTR